jgi:hypothetical protein
MLINKRFLFTIMSFAVITISQLACAAPFCVSVQGIPAQCHFVDAVQCQKISYESGGICTVNRDEFLVLSGSGAYCTIDSSRYANCSYSDRATCEKEALASSMVCIDNTKPFEDQEDLYRLDPNLKY